MAGGHRSFDVLHVATALHLGARDFLTFDANQRKLAAAEKLKVKPQRWDEVSIEVSTISCFNGGP
jgi:hypothetical protein